MGFWLGEELMEAEQKNQMAKVVKAAEGRSNRYDKQKNKRDKVTRWGKWAKKLIPGAGHIADFILDRYAETRYDLYSDEDKRKMLATEDFFTGDTAKTASDKLQKRENQDTTTFGEALLSQLLDYAGTEVASNFLGVLKEVPSGVQEYGFKDTMARSFGIGGDKFAEGVTQQGLADNPWLMQDDYFAEGGQVSKYYGGGSVPNGNSSPTIADYFNMQGKTLGGSNKQSIAEKLGRI